MDSSSTAASRRPLALEACAVAFAAAATSANALSGEFVYDDVQNVLQNPWVHDPARLGEAFATHLGGFDPRFSTSYYRPLFHVLLAATHAVAGLAPWAFHLVSVALHVACSVLVWLLATRTVPSAPAPRRFAGALLAGLLFAVHPIHTESVAWISGITDLSYAVFLLGALAVALQPRPASSAQAALAGALALLSLLCKEPAVALYAAVPAVFAARGDLADPVRRRGAVRVAAALAGAMAVYLAMRVSALGGLFTPGAARNHASSTERILTGLALLAEYARTLLVPTGLSALHDFRVVRGLELAAAAGALLAVAAALAAWRARRAPDALLALCLLVVPILPALHLPALGEGLFADRYLYLPSAGAALLLGLAWDRWVAPRPSIAPRLAAACVIAALSVATVLRNEVWHDHLSLWTDAAARAPSSAAAHENLGFAMLSAGRYEEAAAALERALAIDDRRSDARVNLASTLTALGRPSDAYPLAVRAVREHPAHAEAHTVLGQTLAASGLLADALAEFRTSLELNPAQALVHDAIGRAYARLGNFEAAEEEIRTAVELEPTNAIWAHDLELVLGR